MAKLDMPFLRKHCVSAMLYYNLLLLTVEDTA
jgi:hypothetical protein